MDKRQAEVERLTLEYEKQCLKDLQKSYTEALADVKLRLKGLLGREEQTQSVIYQIQLQEQIQQQLETALNRLKSGSITSVTDFLNKTYEDSYLGVIYGLQGQGIPINIGIDHDQLARTVNRKTDTLQFSDRLYKNVDNLGVAFKSQMSRGIASGSTYSRIAKQLAMESEASYKQAMRIVRTEGGRVKSEAKLNSMHAAKKEGADIVKQWDSTFDGKTRPEHRFMDGQIKEIDEPFIDSQGREAQAPHKFGVASMDINCRCIVVERARWAVEGEEMPNKVHNHTGDLVEAKDYKEWKEKAAKQLEDRKGKADKGKAEDESAGVLRQRREPRPVKKVYDKQSKELPKAGDEFLHNGKVVKVEKVNDYHGIKSVTLDNGKTVVMGKVQDAPAPLKSINDYDFKAYAKQLDENGYLADNLLSTHQSYGYSGNDLVVKKLLDDNGYSDLPTVLNADDFDALSDDDFIKVYRGVVDGKGISAKDINKQFAESKDIWVGRGVFGNGTYTNGAKWVGKEYAKDVEENIMSMAIPKNAKIINAKDLEMSFKPVGADKPFNMQIYDWIEQEYMRGYKIGQRNPNANKGYGLRSLLNDQTFKAVNLGADIIQVDPEDWLKVLSNPEEWKQYAEANGLPLEPHYVVLNRGKVIVKGE